eukprot:CAMPEP_0203932774 /NCGR_PEP_ID=MMETSP0359-20131031/71088_1 /ASSEMBLY_ACC=CAM_ASM_000338 /TAXON_ID=268821 /ORGANISM="Scrippsiella Hangoei, Strain SHTV-5" /LENGTH=100 /DNA_ID=CAMNT_0050862253 /DNA_START=1 /DNA_END=300 /DNA_ORIENTATION=+
MPVELIRLEFNTLRLEDHMHLRDVGVVRDSTLQMRSGLWGGMQSEKKVPERTSAGSSSSSAADPPTSAGHGPQASDGAPRSGHAAGGGLGAVRSLGGVPP